MRLEPNNRQRARYPAAGKQSAVLFMLVRQRGRMTQSRRTARSVVPLVCSLITITGSAAAQPPKETQPEPAPAANAEEQNAEGAASVEFVKCKGLDVAETERLLRVELAVIAARVERARAPSVRIECKRDVLHIEVKDPASGGMKALTLPAPRVNTPDRERTMALAASQLFLSSWLEMITREPQPKPSAPEPKPATPPPGRAAARDLGVQAAEYRYGPTGWELWTSGTVNFRHLGNGVRTLSPSLTVRRRLQQRLLLEGKLAWETGDSARAAGAIDWFAGTAGAGLGVRAGSPPAFVDALVSSSLLLVRAAGDPDVSGVRGAERDAAAFQLALHVGPTLAFSRFRLGLIGQIGFVTPHLTARSPRDEPAYFDGAWAGAGLALGGEIAQ
jgi:hypothetical protein